MIAQQLAHPQPAKSAASGAPTAPAPPQVIADTSALIVLDRMADMIGSLHSCSFTLRVGQDEADPSLGNLSRFSDHHVYMTGPDRMHVNTVSEKSHRGYWCDGEQIGYYNYSENNFGTIEALSTIIASIERLHQDYGVDFPAADFFYPTFTDDLIAQSTHIRRLGNVRMDGRDCFRVATKGPKISAQIWIANDATWLPVRFIFTDHTRGNSRYEGAFADWELNPDIPDQIYAFEPPPGASPVRILPRQKGARP